MSIAAGITFPHAAQAIQLTRRTRALHSKRTWRTETVYAITDLRPHQVSAAELAAFIRRHWQIENALHWVRDVTYAEDLSQVRTNHAPQVMATLRNIAISATASPEQQTSPLPSATAHAMPPDHSPSSASPNDFAEALPTGVACTPHVSWRTIRRVPSIYT